MSISRYLFTVLWICSLLSCHSQIMSKDESAKVYAKIQQVAESKFIDFNEAYLIDSENNKVSFERYKGKWLIIDFWSTGCAPCIKDFPHLTAFYEKNKQHINVIAVSVDNKFERYKKGAKRYKIGVPHFFGGYTYMNPIFNLNIKTSKMENDTYKFMTITPQYVLINPNGKIINKHFPKPSTIEFKLEIEKLIYEFK